MGVNCNLLVLRQNGACQRYLDRIQRTIAGEVAGRRPVGPECQTASRLRYRVHARPFGVDHLVPENLCDLFAIRVRRDPLRRSLHRDIEFFEARYVLVGDQQRMRDGVPRRAIGILLLGFGHDVQVSANGGIPVTVTVGVHPVLLCLEDSGLYKLGIELIFAH